MGLMLYHSGSLLVISAPQPPGARYRHIPTHAVQRTVLPPLPRRECAPGNAGRPTAVVVVRRSALFPDHHSADSLGEVPLSAQEIDALAEQTVTAATRRVRQSRVGTRASLCCAHLLATVSDDPAAVPSFAAGAGLRSVPARSIPESPAGTMRAAVGRPVLRSRSARSVPRDP